MEAEPRTCEKGTLLFTQAKLVDEDVAALDAAAGLVLLLGDAGEGAEGAGADAGGLHAVLHPLVAAVALDHLAVGGAVAGRAEGAGHGAALAADAVGVVVHGKAGLRVLAHFLCRTLTMQLPSVLASVSVLKFPFLWVLVTPAMPTKQLHMDLCYLPFMEYC